MLTSTPTTTYASSTAEGGYDRIDVTVQSFLAARASARFTAYTFAHTASALRMEVVQKSRKFSTATPSFICSDGIVLQQAVVQASSNHPHRARFESSEPSIR